MGRVLRGIVAFWRPQFLIILLVVALIIGLWPQMHSIKLNKRNSEPISLAHQMSFSSNRSRPVPATIAASSDPVNCAAQPCIALTFDDGPNPIATPMVLSALEQAQVPATFFVVGSRAITMPDILLRMHKDGDEIGDHSWSHPDMTTLSPDKVLAQIAMTESAVTAAGVPAPTLFRPPYGYINNVMRDEIHMPFIMWDDDPDDWQSLNAQQVVASAESQAKPGAIVELHDIYESTGTAMPELIQDLKAHYQLVTVSQLLNLQPGDQGIFYSR
jgi:peptidoglycan/xylan/chitin deacetylase (PgdA/CDA1 family)